jgi:hypothetical protein
MPGIDWSQVGNAPIFEKGNFFNPGRYKLQLLKVISKQTQRSGLAFIAELEVLESDNPAHQIGSKGTYFVKMANQQQAFSNVLELMAALLGLDISNPAHVQQIDQQLRPQLAGLMTALETQGVGVLSGNVFVSVECRKQRTQRGNEFTRHAWAPWRPVQGWVPQATPAVAAMPQHCEGGPTYPPAGAPAGYPGAPPYAAPGGYPPPGYGAPPPAVQGWAPPAQAVPPPQAPAWAPPGAPAPAAAPPGIPAAGFQWGPR